MGLTVRAALVRHPDSPAGPVRGIEVTVSRDDAGTLAVSYVLQGDCGRLRIPAWSGAHEADRLWEHTCFELFVRTAAAPAYHELNFAPSGAWAAYAFRRYRERLPEPVARLVPDLSVAQREGMLELTASIALERLSRACVRSPLELGVTAVIEDSDGALAYWALAHPAGKPDFHDKDGFRIRLS